MSSTAVFESSHYTQLTLPVREADELVAGNGIPTGYGMSRLPLIRLATLCSAEFDPMRAFGKYRSIKMGVRKDHYACVRAWSTYYHLPARLYYRGQSHWWYVYILL